MKTTLLFLVTILVLSSCSKYENGGASLKSKKQRLTNKWIVSDAWINDLNMTLEYRDDLLEITKEGNTTAITKYNDVFHGDWEFSEEKESILIRTYYQGSTDVNQIQEWTIMRLKSNDLWLLSEINGDLYEFHYSPMN